MRKSGLNGLKIALAISLICTSANALSLSDPFAVTKQLPVKKQGACDNLNIPDQLNLVAAINIALCNNPDTRISWATAKASAARLGQARSDYLPTVNLNASASRSRNSSNNNNINNNSTQSNYRAGLSLDYLLYDFGGREANVESVKQQMLAAGWNYSSQMQLLVFQVVKGYLDVFTARETLDAARKAEESSKKAYEAAQARLKVGLVTPADTAQAETAYSQTKLSRERADNTLKLANGNFDVLLHLPPTMQLNLAPIDPDRIGNDLQGEVDALIKQALDNRPDLAASKAREKQAKANLDLARSGDYPAISLNGSAGRNSSSNNFDDSRNDSSIGVSLSVPLFTGFNTTYQKLAAKNNLEGASFERQRTEDSVMLDVWTSYHNYQTAIENYSTAKVLLRSAEASEALTLGRYQSGKGTLLDALDSQAKLADARRQWVESRYNTLITRFDLLRSVGADTWNLK